VRRALLLLFLLLWARPALALGSEDEEAAYRYLLQDNLIRLRQASEEILRRRPDSFAAHFMLGYALHRGDGDLPRARYHLEKARDLFRQKGQRGASSWMTQTLFELKMVLGEMDLYAEQIQAIDDYNRYMSELYGPGWQALEAEYAWPLMKLGRQDQARRKIQASLQRRDEISRTMAWNSLGALEMETGHARESYEAFRSLLEEVRTCRWQMNPTFLRNAGETALAIGRFDEAERYFRQATDYFDPDSFSNPWWDLAGLYLGQGRFLEAAQAVGNMHQWARASRPYLDQQTWADNQQRTGEVLLELGEVSKAYEVLSRTLQRPDRRGGTSGKQDQSEAGNLMAWRVAALARRQLLAEEMSRVRGWRWWSLAWERRKLGWQAWAAGRRVAALAVKNRRVQGSLRFYFSGSILMADWYRPDLVELYGPGVAAQALAELRRSAPQRLPLEEPYLDLIEAEICRLYGRRSQATAHLERALQKLPPGEVLLRARAHLRLAQLEADPVRALQHYQQVLQRAPSLVRTLGGEIPVQVRGADNPTLRRAAAMIEGSPRFARGSPGFELALSGTGAQVAAVLLGKDGSVLARAQVPVQAGPEATAALLVEELHEQAFSARIDGSQVDLDSLDGSNLSGSTATRRFRDLFGEPQPRL
jgi:tetratricopeptide (TPR) repeat protein